MNKTANSLDLLGFTYHWGNTFILPMIWGIISRYLIFMVILYGGSAEEGQQIKNLPTLIQLLPIKMV